VPPSGRRKRPPGTRAGGGFRAAGPRTGSGYQVVDSRKQIWTIGRPPLAGLARDQHGLSCIELASWCIELAERRTGTYLGIRDDVKTSLGSAPVSAGLACGLAGGMGAKGKLHALLTSRARLDRFPGQRRVTRFISWCVSVEPNRGRFPVRRYQRELWP